MFGFNFWSSSSMNLLELYLNMVIGPSFSSMKFLTLFYEVFTHEVLDLNLGP